MARFESSTRTAARSRRKTCPRGRSSPVDPRRKDRDPLSNGKEDAMAVVGACEALSRSPRRAATVMQAINVFRDITAERASGRTAQVPAARGRRAQLVARLREDLAAVARLAVPVLADWCAVDIVEGETFKRLATAHVDPDKVAAVARAGPAISAGPPGQDRRHEIVRSGQAQLLREIPRELLTAAAVDEEHLKLIEALQPPLLHGGAAVDGRQGCWAR